MNSVLKIKTPSEDLRKW